MLECGISYSLQQHVGACLQQSSECRSQLSHLDLEVEVWRICDLCLEHGPVLAHEVAVDTTQGMATLRVLQAGLQHQQAILKYY